ncbi:MAG: hypothetical protein WKF76_12760 [Nocardioidaceae bacterium]
MVDRIAADVRAYVLLARMWIRVSMSYRTSFVILTVGQFLISGLDFVAILVMFTNIDALGGSLSARSRSCTAGRRSASASPT